MTADHRVYCAACGTPTPTPDQMWCTNHATVTFPATLTEDVDGPKGVIPATSHPVSTAHWYTTAQATTTAARDQHGQQ